MKLYGKKVHVNGGTGALGYKIAMSFATRGADVAIYYNKARSEAARLVKDIEAIGRRAVAVRTEVRNVSSIKNAIDIAARSLGGIDILVNAVGMFQRSPVGKVTEKMWNEMFDVNLRSHFFFVQSALKHLYKSGNGRVVNIADTYGASPSANFVPYGITKAGVIAMTKGLAKELAPGILVNCICPGVIEKSLRGPSDERAIKASLLKREVVAQDMVDAVLFLACNDSMTGQSVFIDGGRSCTL